MVKNKVFPGFAEAVADVPDGASIMIGGFGGAGGMPQNLLLALRDQGARELTIIANTAGLGTTFGVQPGKSYVDASILSESGQVRKAIASFTVEAFSTERLQGLSREEIDSRLTAFRALTEFRV